MISATLGLLPTRRIAPELTRGREINGDGQRPDLEKTKGISSTATSRLEFTWASCPWGLGEDPGAGV